MPPHGGQPCGCAVAESSTGGKGHSGRAAASSGLRCSSDAADHATTDAAHSTAENDRVKGKGEELFLDPLGFTGAALADGMIFDSDDDELDAQRSNTSGHFQQTSGFLDMRFRQLSKKIRMVTDNEPVPVFWFMPSDVRTCIWISPMPLPNTYDPQWRGIFKSLLDQSSHQRRALVLGTTFQRMEYSVDIWQRQVDAGLPRNAACMWCGLPTGCFCDGVGSHISADRFNSFVIDGWHCGQAICTECDRAFGACPECTLWVGKPRSVTDLGITCGVQDARIRASYDGTRRNRC